MLFIDMTKELAPIMYGFNVALIVSAAAIVWHVAVSTWFRSVGRFVRPRIVVHRPALVR